MNVKYFNLQYHIGAVLITHVTTLSFLCNYVSLVEWVTSVSSDAHSPSLAYTVSSPESE